METRMDRLRIGDIVSYNSSYSRVGDKVGLVVKKIDVGDWKIISDRELGELAALRVISKQAVKAKRMFNPTKSSFKYVIILEARENKMSITYKLVIKNVRHVYIQRTVRAINYDKLERDAKERVSNTKKERLKNEIIKTKRVKAAAIKRKKTIQEKQESDGWDDMKLAAQAIRDEHNADRRLQTLLKRSRETIFGREK